MARKAKPKPKVRTYGPPEHLASALQYYSAPNKKTGKPWTKDELAKKVNTGIIRLLAIHGIMMKRPKAERILPQGLEEALLELVPGR